MANRFNIAKRGGYEIEEVDRYINTLETIVKSYKDKDSAIKNALVNAEIAADNIVKNAELEAEKIKSKAVIQLDEIISSVDIQKQLVRDFENEYTAILKKYLQRVDSDNINSINRKLGDLEKFIKSLSISKEQESGNNNLSNNNSSGNE